MFRKMRREKQMLSLEECASILEKATSGVLALSGDDGYPYAVPLSYVYEKSECATRGDNGQGEASENNSDNESDYGKIYFHCAVEGHKIDAVKNCGKASFCVVAQDDVIPLEYSTRYKSVIAFGHVRIIEDDTEKRRTIEMLGKRYAPNDSEKNRNDEIDKYWNSLCMIEMCIEYMTGKQSKNNIGN